MVSLLSLLSSLVTCFQLSVCFGLVSPLPPSERQPAEAPALSAGEAVEPVSVTDRGTEPWSLGAPVLARACWAATLTASMVSESAATSNRGCGSTSAASEARAEELVEEEAELLATSARSCRISVMAVRNSEVASSITDCTDSRTSRARHSFKCTWRSPQTSLASAASARRVASSTAARMPSSAAVSRRCSSSTSIENSWAASEVWEAFEVLPSALPLPEKSSGLHQSAQYTSWSSLPASLIWL
mmetsp:Transcript_79567/g.138059  ORF Transcript_79567/g.138059 Transcript_79567/m.138059 type:complete len:244 (+) Transcript_79567:713-1444(+)